MGKTIAEINEKIKRGKAVVVTAEEMAEIVHSEGTKKAAEKIDVVTTGTFGPMCSSGAFINLGHSEPPIRMEKVWLNDVPVCADLAAVDIYVGATALSENEGMNYGGGHLIEDFVQGNWIKLRAIAHGTDCYPRREINTWINKEVVNQAFLFNPRNAYQNYACATNSTERTLYTYMGVLLPNFGNVTYSSAGQLSPLLNDPYYRTIGIGTRVFLCGANGYVAWQGTQHKPSSPRTGDGFPVVPAGTIALIGDLKQMSVKYLRGAKFSRYGATIYVGVGIPIPVLDEEMARFTGVSDEELVASVFDYGVPSRERPKLGEVTYKELRSGSIELLGRRIPSAPLSSYKVAREIAHELKVRIADGKFILTEPLEPLPKEGELNSLEVRRRKHDKSG